MADNFFADLDGGGGGYGTQGGSYSSYQGGGGGGYAPGGVNDPGGSAYDGYDPFAYTKGSLLTPWEGKFSYTGGSGGSGVADFRPFEYDNFGYQAKDPGQFQERYNDPGNFVYGDYQSPEAFKAPTEADMKQDPGYQARMKAGQKALQASKAAQGVLKTGGTAKAIAKYGQEYGTNEYDKVYARRSGEYDRNLNEGRQSYATNRNNNAENWDRNIANQRQGYQIRQGAWKDNAAVTLEASRHGYDVAQGTYDRNLQLARQKHDDLVSHEQSVAAANAANASRSYNQALNEYTMARDEFWTNQDRQYAILDREAERGYRAAYDYASMSGNNAIGRGDARAGSAVAQGNARANAGTNIGGTIGGLALYGANQYQSSRAPQRPPVQGGGTQYSGIPDPGNPHG